MKRMKLDIQKFASTPLSSEGVTPVLTPDFYNTDDYQLQLQENFVIIFQSKPGFDGFELLAASVTPPTRSYETIPVNYANKTINVAGRVSFGTMNIVVRDVIKKDTELQLTKWAESILSVKEGTRGSIEKYKVNIEIIPLSPNGDSGRPSIARGCFPVEINWGDLSYDSTGVRTVSITLAVDDYARKEVWDGTVTQKNFDN